METKEFNFNIENETNIPAVLKSLPNWIIWKLELNKDGKLTKVPYQSNQPTGKASSTDLTTWSTYQEAILAFKDCENESIQGIGFVLTGSPYTVIDIDHCIEDGKTTPEAQEIIDSMKSYAEITPSGTGVHVWVKGKMPAKYGSGKKKGIEVYSEKRYITVTGQRLKGFKDIMPNQTELDALCEDYFAESGSSPPASDEGFKKLCGTSSLSDTEIFYHILASEQKEKFYDLFHKGDTTPYKGDDSSADLALCNILAFWTNRDPEVMDRLFRQSKLFRDKWNRADYRDRTIREAIEKTKPKNAPQERNHAQPIRFSDVSYTPREPIIKGFPLYKKLIYVHSAEGGGYKSGSALSLSKSVLSGKPLFGRYEIVRKGPVLLFDDETPEPIMEERLNSFGLKDPALDGYLFHFSGLRIDEISGLTTIQAMIEQYNPVLCIFDSLTRFHSAEENSNTEMKAVMMGFRTLAEMGPAIWLIHHVAKESKSTRGAAEIVNAVDLEFRSTVNWEGLITLGTGKVRIEKPEPIVLKPIFEPGKFDILYYVEQGAHLREQIREILEASNEPITVEEIRDKLEDKNITSKAVTDILKKDIGVKCGSRELIEIMVPYKGGEDRKRKVWHYSA